MTEKTTQAQRDASRKWEQKNKERNRYLASRRSARSFIRNYAKAEDLEELLQLIEEKQNELDSVSENEYTKITIEKKEE